MNAASKIAGLKRMRNKSLNNNNGSNENNNSLPGENLAEVNISGLIEQVRTLGVGNEMSPGFRLSPSLENLPARSLNSPRNTPSKPYRNLFPKPLRRFGSLPLAAMGASPPSEKKYKTSGSEGNMKSRRSRRNRRGSRRSRRGGATRRSHRH